MPRFVVPTEVLDVVSHIPEMWPAIIEMGLWYRDVRTGRIEITFMDGDSRELVRTERLALGKTIKLPADAIPICPECQGKMGSRDYGAKLYCEPCDRLWTVWEIKRRNSFMPSTTPMAVADGPVKP